MTPSLSRGALCAKSNAQFVPASRQEYPADRVYGVCGDFEVAAMAEILQIVKVDRSLASTPIRSLTGLVQLRMPR
jgi:hypothetical protein